MIKVRDVELFSKDVSFLLRNSQGWGDDLAHCTYHGKFSKN